MRGKIAVVAASLLMVSGAVTPSAGETEQEIVDRFLKRVEAKHTRRITWLAANFGLNRINRHNDYNNFAIYTTAHFTNGNIPWLDKAKSFGVEAGLMLGNNFSWSLGGEYWLKLGINQTGSFNYVPPGGTPSTVENLISEITVWGLTTGLQYYLYNPPTKSELLSRPAVRIGGSVGYYQVNWDLWDAYSNLNLATSTPTESNATYKGSAPSLSINVGVDYPLPFLEMTLGVDMSYLYLNFTNVAWYNQSNEEIVATYDGTADGRVVLGLSGVRGKVELKRFFKL